MAPVIACRTPRNDSNAPEPAAGDKRPFDAGGRELEARSPPPGSFYLAAYTLWIELDHLPPNQFTASRCRTIGPPPAALFDRRFQAVLNLEQERAWELFVQEKGIGPH